MEEISRRVWYMAMFRLEAKVFSRERKGRSVIAAAAYRAGTKLKDEIRDKIFDYARRSKGVVFTTIVAPDAAPKWASNPGTLWNAVEAGEKRKDAQLAREFVLAVPPELSKETQFETAVNWAKNELVKLGMVAEISLHHTKSGKNPHVHILATMRTLDGDHFSKKKMREWNDVAMLVKQRESWAAAVNTALEKAGRDERVDHRSLKDQGIDREPEPKIGVAATAMKRKGLLFDPERFQAVRRVKLLNDVRAMMRSIIRTGEVEQTGGGGDTWWEKSVVFMDRVREKAGQAVEKTWQKLLDSRQSKDERKGPDLEK